MRNRHFPEDDEKRFPMKGSFWKGFLESLIEFLVILALVCVIILAVLMIFSHNKI